jgi:hypothetical protein
MNRNFFIIALFCSVVLLAACGKGGSSITLPKTEFAPGETVTIKYKAVGEFGSNPWIGIIPSDIPHGDEDRNDQHDVSYKYFTGAGEGELTFTVPNDPGNWDFRMHTTDSRGKEVASVSFKVVAR